MMTMAAASPLLAAMPSFLPHSAASHIATRVNKAPLRALASKRESVDSIATVTAAEGPNSNSRRALLLLGLTAATSAWSLQGMEPASAALSPPCELIETPSGLLFCDSLTGEGGEAESGLLIKAHYSGRLLNGTEFDSSYKRGRPLVFRVGVGEVIKGWDLGIVGGKGIPAMRVGGRRTLRIPAALAYGDRGAGCRGGTCVIPPASDLIFDVEFVGVV